MSHLKRILRFNSLIGETFKHWRPISSFVKPQSYNHNIQKLEVLNNIVEDADGRSKLVIFDKDGTLICFTTMWKPWVVSVTSKLAAISGINDIDKKAYSVLGVCTKTQSIGPGLLAEGTRFQIKEALVKLLKSEGLSKESAEAAVLESLAVELSVGSENLQQLRDLRLLFSTLREYGLKIAICTSDCRQNTIRTLIELGVINLVDKVVCGDDPTGLAKPSAHNALMICDQLKVHPNQAVMVGDTKTDMEFAQNAGLSMAVGVLSGIGRLGELQESGAHHVVETIEDILPIVLPNRTIGLTPEARKIGEQDWDLIIMDKDGTLSDTQGKWLSWALTIGQKLSTHVGEDTEAAFYDIIGLDRSSYSIYGSLLTYIPVLEMNQMLRHLLLMKGVHPRSLDEMMAKVWEDGSQFAEVPMDGMIEILTVLRSKTNLKLALLTSDVKASTMKFLSQVNAEDLFDCVLTNDDLPRTPKPLPHGIHHIVEHLKVDLKKTLMIGDSPFDMQCGQAAKVGAKVAVLSGISHPEALLPFADALIPNVTYLPKLLNLGTKDL